jgi:hypothetical protein
MPTRITKGRILVHNQAPHDKDTVSGIGGFVAWTEPEEWLKDCGYVNCRCGWAGLPHYRINV